VCLPHRHDRRRDVFADVPGTIAITLPIFVLGIQDHGPRNDTPRRLHPKRYLLIINGFSVDRLGPHELYTPGPNAVRTCLSNGPKQVVKGRISI